MAGRGSNRVAENGAEIMHKAWRRLAVVAVMALSAIATQTQAQAQSQAQSFPNRQIKIVVPATPGGAIDLIARLVGDKLAVALGQSVVIENKAGAANNLGTDFVAKSPPDGYTLVIVASSHATNKFLYKQMPFDPIADFEPVVFTHIVPLLLAVNPQVPAKTVQELIAWVKANPEKASFASSGKGSSLHMAAELFQSMASVKMLHVPYRGSSAAHPDLLGGRTAMIFDTITAIQPHVKSGGVRGIAVTTPKRSAAQPDLPTISESGLPGYDANTWGGILAPAGTPKDVVAKLNAEINKALAAEDVRAKLMDAGIDIQGGTPERFAEYIKGEVAKWGKVTAEAGIQPE
jgi:tripartite-type tricarboxylate transporter receptor subunit TctC